MPKTTKTNRTPKGYTKNHTKRHGQHHSRNHKYIKVYAPYLPLFISIIASLLLSFWQPAASANTLAYATEMSRSGLLAATNAQRVANGDAPLTINTKLNSSAQAKADDMVAKNYWSHNTPSGQEPWVFIDGAGYLYLKAGENLAYGFTTSSDAITGWMNSPAHKANMLDKSFTEVGFGFANSKNFNNSGKETVVVAHYGKPQVQGVSITAAPPATTTPKATPKPAAKPAPKATPTPTPTPKPAATPTPTPQASPTTNPAKPSAFNTDQAASAATLNSQNVSKVQTLTGGKLPWIASMSLAVMIGALLALMLQHSYKIRLWWHDHRHGTNNFTPHHPLLLSTLLGLTLFAAVLCHTVGVIL